MRKSSLVLAIGLVGSVAFAIGWGSRDVGASAATQQPPPSNGNEPQAMDQGDFAGAGEVDTTQPLPPNHPSINGGGAMGQAAQADQEPPSLVWKAPKEWAAAPNPNAMRLATYKITDDTELVVARAGGDVATNVARWAGQFDGSPAPKQTDKTVHGLKVTIVQIEGTYQGGMGPTTGSHPSWAMLGAIVETSGEDYFFKVIGPAATVRAAKKPFEAMIDGLASR